MKNALRITVAVMCLSLGALWAQQSGTINGLSVNPRQNEELTNSTGTETGQPSDSVPGSENQDNGLVPVTSNMGGSASQTNPNQPAAGSTAAAEPNATMQPGQTRNQPPEAMPTRSKPAVKSQPQK